MSHNRYGKRADKTQSEVIKMLLHQGCLVEIIGRPVDLLCGYRGIMFTVEVKTGKAKETAGQIQWRDRCAANKLPHRVIRSGESVANMLDTLC